ncbi:MAG: arylesterase [Bdellovibrionales bacterium]|nr:arylesterase [Bdellovibrionales bacterium]
MGTLLVCTGLLSSIEEASADERDALRILFLGDSLTAGYGVAPEEAYPALLAQRIEQANLPFAVQNAGVSGDTTAGGLRRLSWLLRQPVAVLVLALGANDGLRGLNLTATEENLRAIIERAREKNPNIRIVLAGMLVPPNMGEEYAKQFRALYHRVAEKEQTALVPFLLESVAAEPGLNLADGIHPNPEGYKLVANNVWQHLEPVLRELQAQTNSSAETELQAN